MMSLCFKFQSGGMGCTIYLFVYICWSSGVAALMLYHYKGYLTIAFYYLLLVSKENINIQLVRAKQKRQGCDLGYSYKILVLLYSYVYGAPLQHQYVHARVFVCVRTFMSVVGGALALCCNTPVQWNSKAQASNTAYHFFPPLKYTASFYLVHHYN